MPSQGRSRNGGHLSCGPWATGKMMLGPGEKAGRGVDGAKEIGLQTVRPADA